MKKLRLNVESLRVQSFGTGAAAGGGTVVGYAPIVNPDEPIIAQPAPDQPITDQSRIESCYFNTCYDTCDWTD